MLTREAYPGDGVEFRYEGRPLGVVDEAQADAVEAALQQLPLDRLDDPWTGGVVEDQVAAVFAR